MDGPQPDFEAIGKACKTLSNEMPLLANIGVAQVEQQVQEILNLLRTEYVPPSNSHTQNLLYN